MSRRAGMSATPRGGGGAGSSARSRRSREPENGGKASAHRRKPLQLMPTAPADLAALKHSVRGNFLFAGLSDADMRTVFGEMRKTQVQRGETVIRQGEQGDFFYVVLRGQFDATKDGAARPVFTYTAGGCFGELALMYNCPRAATVTAVSGGVLLALDRRSFRATLMAMHRRAGPVHGETADLLGDGHQGAGRDAAAGADEREGAGGAGGGGYDKLAKQKAFLRRKMVNFALGGGADTAPVWREHGSAFVKAESLIERQQHDELGKHIAALGTARSTASSYRSSSTAASSSSSAAAAAATSFASSTAAGGGGGQQRLRATSGGGVGGSSVNYKTFHNSRLDFTTGFLKSPRPAPFRPATPDVSGDSSAENTRWLQQRVRGSANVKCVLENAVDQRVEDKWKTMVPWQHTRANWHVDLA